MYYSMPAFDSDYKKYSPGSMMLNHLIKKAFYDTKIREFNFMRLEAAYKKWWKPFKKPYRTIIINNNTSALKIYEFYRKLKSNFS